MLWLHPGQYELLTKTVREPSVKPRYMVKLFFSSLYIFN